MKFKEYILEKIDSEKIEKLKKIFIKVPGNSPKSIATYIVNTLQAMNIKPDSDGGTYISGPMTNLPDFYYPVFISAEKYISGKVHNPAKFPHNKMLKKGAAELGWGGFYDSWHILFIEV